MSIKIVSDLQVLTLLFNERVLGEATKSKVQFLHIYNAINSFVEMILTIRLL